ncbi:PepSY domain-containing protein [Methanobacterium sp.]|uniref:PepSY domain-containing protein n=1 Tax=Methanobacterium sp. TaxID=2164 RepID=UPI003C787226
MIKKSIIAIVVMLAAAALVFGASGNHINSTGNSNQGQQSSVASSSSSDDTSDSSKISDNTTETKITSAEAQKLAQKYIDVEGATAGTPKLIKTDGQYVYAVPVISNGTNVGEIDINAITGKNVGGAGGAP